MSNEDSILPEQPADSRSNHISAARAQVVAARLRQRRIGTSERFSLSNNTGFPSKGPPGYTLLRELQRGGQGVVYVAIQESTARQVAIKQLHVGLPSAVAATRLARFEREVEVLSRLKHPNIVTIHDCGRHDNTVYLVMDYINGRPVDACVDRDKSPLTETLNLFARICDGVNAAHLHGVIHRDLKPGNILVDENGTPHVLDFGLAKLADDSVEITPSLAMTATGQFVGSLPWASPEQAEGRAELLDIRTDVYSLGVVLYQLLTGRFPYPVTGKLDDVVRHIVNTQPTRPSVIRRNLDREMDTILLKCLAKEPERRYQNAGELARDIRRYLAGQAIDARGDSAWYIISKQLRQHRAVLLAGCAFVALIVTSSITAWWLYAAAVRAQNADQAHLWESLVAQARAGRNGEHVGRRNDSLGAICQARDIRYARELRDEAVACLALPDLRCVGDFGIQGVASSRGLRSIDRFALVDGDGRVEIREAASGSRVASLDADGGVTSFTFSPDGGMLAVRAIHGGQGDISLWDIASHKLLMRVNCARFAFGDCAFSADGHRLCIVGADQHASVFELPSTQRIAEVDPGFKITAIDFDAAGTRLALVAGDAPRVSIWDLAEAREVRRLNMPDYSFVPAWSPDGTMLAVGSNDHNVYIFDLRTDAPPHTLSGHRGPVAVVAFSSDGDRLVSSGWDRQVRVWDMGGCGRPMATFVGWALAGVSDRLALIRGDRLTIWKFMEVDILRELRVGEGNYSQFACFVGGSRFIVARGPEGISLLDLTHSGAPIPLESREARRPSASSDGRHVYCVVENQIVEWTLSVESDKPVAVSRRIISVAESPTDVSVSHDLHRFLVCSGSEVFLHDAATGQALGRAEIGYGIESPSLSPDGRLAFIGNWKGSQNTACLLDLEKMRVIRRFPGNSVAGVFSADNRYLAVCTPTHIETWDIPGDTLHWSMPRESGQDLAVRPAFSPDGRELAICASLYDVHIVNADSGQLVVRLANPMLHMIGDLEFSKDGQSLLVGTSSSVVQVWDLDALRRELSKLRLGW